MVKRVSDLQLAELKEMGEVVMDPERREVAQLGELIDQLRLMVTALAERTAADLARSQVQLEILATLQKSINNGTKSQNVAQTIDLEPLQQVLAQVHEHHSQAYQFDIQRADNNGPMQRVIAIPIEPTRH